MKALILLLALIALPCSAQLITTAEPAPPTAAELAADSIIDAINNEIAHRVSVHKVAFETLWKNTREGATPEAILLKLGTKATLVLQFASENIAHIDRCARLVGKTRADFIPDADCIPPRELVFHQNGTVTLKP